MTQAPLSRMAMATTVTLAFALAALSGCTSAEGQTGTAAVFVKDAPADDITNLYVSFTKVEIHQVRAGNESLASEDGNATSDDDDAETSDDRDDGNATDDADEADGNETVDTETDASTTSTATEAQRGEGGKDSRGDRGKRDHSHGDLEADEDDGRHKSHDERQGQWITIFEGNATVDLKAFSGNASAFLSDAQVPVGKYNGIRVTVSAASAVLVSNGTTVDVKVPSGALRIRGHFEVTQGTETALTLDFNLTRSLHQTGNGQYILKPVLRLSSIERDAPSDAEREERREMREERREQFEKRGGHRAGHDQDRDDDRRGPGGSDSTKTNRRPVSNTTTTGA